MRKIILSLMAAAGLVLGGCNVSTVTADVATVIQDVQLACNLVLLPTSASGLLTEFGLGNIAAIISAACSVVPRNALAKAKARSAIGVTPTSQCYGIVKGVPICGYIVTPSEAKHYRHLIGR